MRKVQLLYRHPETGYVEPTTTNYSGPVPPKVWKRLDRQFAKLDAARYFYPCDGRDGYHDAIVQAYAAAERIASGEIALKKSNAEKYLTGVAFRALAHFHQRLVLPMRDTYRQTEQTILGVEQQDEIARTHNAPEGNDVGGASYAEAVEDGRSESPQPMTAQQLAESLPAIPDARERRLRAALALEEIYAALLHDNQEDVVHAFRCYVKADGNMLEAAHLARIPKSCFYRSWRTWLKIAREVAA